jgi:ATP-dependent Clp protease ATP-binding subunit ClpX
VGKKGYGFGAEIKTKEEKRAGELVAQVQPEDLLKFGMIPEFIGRLPLLATLEELDERSLVDILEKPRNAITKQYQKLFEYEGVKLKFTKGAIRSIAREAIKRQAGARGLRAILEEVMLDIMYEIPSQTGIKECVVNEEVITKREEPLIVLEKKQESA